jgi:hypothetical protein
MTVCFFKQVVPLCIPIYQTVCGRWRFGWHVTPLIKYVTCPKCREKLKLDEVNEEGEQC